MRGQNTRMPFWSVIRRTGYVAVAAAAISISISTGVRFLMGTEADSVTVAVRFSLPFLIAIPIGLVWFNKLEKLEASYCDLLRKTNELMTKAGTDPLTGLRNRRSLRNISMSPAPTASAEYSSSPMSTI